MRRHSNVHIYNWLNCCVVTKQKNKKQKRRRKKRKRTENSFSMFPFHRSLSVSSIDCSPSSSSLHGFGGHFSNGNYRNSFFKGLPKRRRIHSHSGITRSSSLTCFSIAEEEGSYHGSLPPKVKTKRRKFKKKAQSFDQAFDEDSPSPPPPLKTGTSFRNKYFKDNTKKNASLDEIDKAAKKERKMSTESEKFSTLKRIKRCLSVATHSSPSSAKCGSGTFSEQTLTKSQSLPTGQSLADIASDTVKKSSP